MGQRLAKIALVGLSLEVGTLHNLGHCTYRVVQCDTGQIAWYHITHFLIGLHFTSRNFKVQRS